MIIDRHKQCFLGWSYQVDKRVGGMTRRPREREKMVKREKQGARRRRRGRRSPSNTSFRKDKKITDIAFNHRILLSFKVSLSASTHSSHNVRPFPSKRACSSAPIMPKPVFSGMATKDFQIPFVYGLLNLPQLSVSPTSFMLWDDLILHPLYHLVISSSDRRVSPWKPWPFRNILIAGYFQK